jgi:hypothetical protein
MTNGGREYNKNNNKKEKHVGLGAWLKLVECLLSNCKSLNSTPSTSKKEK